MPSNSKSPASRSITNDLVKFCHYKNAMYMGGMRFFEREGRGLLFHDSGDISLTCFEKDKMQGNTLLITKNMEFLSLSYHLNELSEVVSKTNQHLLYLKYKHGVPDGQGVLINFGKELIYHITYKQGKYQGKKKENDKQLLNKVFNHFIYSFLVPIHHLKTLDFEFKNPGFRVTKKNHTITVGYYKDNFLNGLGFVLSKEQDQEKTNYCMIEKGFYKNSQLCGIGQKRFQNGNLYIGEFTNSVFDGRGLLFNTEKKKWVRGLFKDGTMIDMADYGQDDKTPKVEEMLQSLHKKKSSWVNVDINFHRAINFSNLINETLYQIERTTEEALNYQEKKELTLRRIQQSFFPESPLKEVERKSPELQLRHTTANFGDSMRSQKKTINSFETQYDKTNNMMRLSPAKIADKKRRHTRSPRNLRNSRQEFDNKSMNQSQIKPSPKSPRNAHMTMSKTSVPNQQSRVKSNKSNSEAEQKKSRLFSASKPKVNVPRLRTSTLFQNKQERNVIESPLKESLIQNAEIDASRKSEVNKRLFSPAPTDTRREISTSGSRRNKIFNETLKKSPYRNIRLLSPSGSVSETNRMSNPVSPKDLKAAGLTKPTARSRLFNDQKDTEKEQLPTFRYSRFLNENQVGMSERKGRIF